MPGSGTSPNGTRTTGRRRAASPPTEPGADDTALIELLLRARYFAFGATLVLLAGLVVGGRHVGYEQSIKSFFADDDPVMTVYQKAATSFGDDNFVFVAYDDPLLFTADGMDRVAQLAAALGTKQIDGVLRVESLDAMPLLWSVDDTLIRVVQAPPLARGLLLNAAKQAVKGLDLKNNAMTVGGAVRGGPTRRTRRPSPRSENGSSGIPCSSTPSWTRAARPRRSSSA